MDADPSYAGSIFPELHYADARAGIAFLAQAFGFEPQVIAPGGTERVARAVVRVGNDFMLVGTVDAHNSLPYHTPQTVGGANTGSVYIASPDIDALHARAQAAGARIIHAPADTDYGSRDFSALDPEGFLWSFGTYYPVADGGTSRRIPAIFAGLRYRNARAAMAWLCRAFGFEEQFIVPGAGDDIAHAQLHFGDSVLMLGTTHDDDYNLKTPLELNGAVTQTLCINITEPDAHYERARAANADIVFALADTPDGARGFCVRDPEGYVWTLGTYHPALACERSTEPV